MKKNLFFIGFLSALILITSSLFSQDWVSKMQNPNVNFFDVQKSFNKYYQKKNKEIERMKKRAAKAKEQLIGELDDIEVPGYFQYKRWEWFMAPRVSASGERFDPSTVWRENRKYREQYKNANAGNWSLIGPINTIPSGGGGAGRLTFVRFDPTNSNTIYVGSPSGGLWKSTDGGNTWSTNTDQLSHVIGCTDLAIDPTNTNIMYMATGDGDAGDTYSVGVLKSIDGGQTWNSTGLSFFTANYRQISKLLIDPTNTSVILAATSAGIFRSNDYGVTFTQQQTGSFKDMEFKPTDANTVYACGSEFYKSTDNGQTWSKITTGLPIVTNVSRIAIAVTPADNNYVYLIAGFAAPTYGTEGFYKSTNSGTTFTKISTPALGNQQWYDLTIASSPTNKDEILLGGQTDFLRSINGGVNFYQNGGFTHVDYHDIVYTGPTSYTIVSDGGIFKTTNSGSNWTDLSDGLQISQMYGFGQSSTNANLLIQGWQDNGTNRYNGTNWSQILGGDGMLCFIDWNNDQNMWAEYYDGALQRSTNGGASFSSAKGNITEIGAWVTPWMQDPIDAGTIFCGFANIWKSLNGGMAWYKMSTFTNTAPITTLAISAADNLVLWVAKPGALYKSSNGGANWTTITNVPSGTITGIACSNTDPNKAWITYSGFANVNKVFQTTDQGVTWTNLSGSIPNIPVNCITYLNNSNDGLYIGTDLGVFYKDATLNVWQPYYSGLPNVVVTQLSIFYPTGKIRASTYGRGIWESDLYVAGSYPPSAAFGSDRKIACPGAAVNFTDYSAGQPTSWNWTFPGGSPSSSTSQNPVVYFNTPGNFPVSLTVTNAIGTDSITYTSLINISSSPVSAPSTVGASICAPGVANLSATGSGTGNLRWWDAPGGGNMLATGNTYAPSINATTTYYVDEEFPLGAIDYTGGDKALGPGAAFTGNDIRGLYFDVLQPVILNTVEVYPNSAGNRTIEVIDAQGNSFIDTTIYMAASPNSPLQITLNFTLYPGTNYFIKCRGLVDLFRNTGGAVYPYQSTGINVTGSNAGLPGYYYFFYNWTYTQFTCNTARAACTAIDSCFVQGISNLEDGNVLDIFPNPNDGLFSLKFKTMKQDHYLLKITNTLGQIVYQEKLDLVAGELNKKMDIAKYGKGVYLISITNSSNETTKEMVVY